ncbi:MAG TPA: DUF72 domain-containing protein, partial [Nitrososphaeraceae archaeon]|nr:DUF72 domain-containing protein [Nitrososphaeraceae archaeon]
MKYYVGCSGWAYSSWTEFYPRTLNLDDYLAYYSRVFNFVEIDLDNLDQQQSKILKSQRQQQQQEKRPDRHGCGMYDQKNNNDNNSSYDKNDATNVINYHSSTVILPDRKLIKKWSDVTPSDFRFSLKLPIALTNQIDRLGSFLEELAPLEEKILSIRIHQSNLTLKDGRQWLEELLGICTYHGYSAAVEFDHYSWYQDLTYHILKKHKAAMIWTDIEGHTRHYYYPAVTTDFVYLRINKNERKWVQKIKEEEKRQSKEWVEHEHETKHEIRSKQNYYREDGLEFA